MELSSHCPRAAPGRRGELHGQLDRLRDLYVLGDLTKNK
jgi:hypothetical protein